MKVKRYVEGHGEGAREVEVVEFKLWPKDAALDKLAKHLGLFRKGAPEDDALALLRAHIAQRAAQAVEAMRDPGPPSSLP